jgi:hypothetical protein
MFLTSPLMEQAIALKIPPRGQCVMAIFQQQPVSSSQVPSDQPGIISQWLESRDLCSVVPRRGDHTDLLQETEHIFLSPLLN